MKPRVLLVGRERYRLPLNPTLRRKFDALGRELDLRVVASAPERSLPGDETFSLMPPFPVRRVDGLAFWLSLPIRVARALRRYDPDLVLASGTHEAAAALAARALARSDARIVIDIQGDWRTATRLYGASARQLLSPIADRVAAFAVHRADALRTLSPFTSSIVRAEGREPAAEFWPFMYLERFLERPPAPLPERPGALFIGVLERYKGIDVLADAWRRAAPQVPGAQLRLVGDGSRRRVVERLVAEVPEQTAWTRHLTTDEVAAALDDATCLVLPSPREGLGRVVVEALCRGRSVVGARAGGIADLVRDGENGILVEPDDADALAAALVRVLSDHALAERLAAASRPSIEHLTSTPEEYAASVRRLVAEVGRRRAPS